MFFIFLPHALSGRGFGKQHASATLATLRLLRLFFFSIAPWFNAPSFIPDDIMEWLFNWANFSHGFFFWRFSLFFQRFSHQLRTTTPRRKRDFPIRARWLFTSRRENKHG